MFSRAQKLEVQHRLGGWIRCSRTNLLNVSPSEPMCYDWGESSERAVSVLEGEAGWLSCPLFSHPSVYNYTSTQSAGHNLFWYRHPEGHDLEQPITYRYDCGKF